MFGSLIHLSPFEPGEPAPKPRWRPHGAEALGEVRRLIETTHLSYRAIQARTRVPRATISRHVLEQGWMRPWVGMEEPPHAPEAKRRAKRGELAARLLRAAEYRVEQVTMNPTAPASAFAQATKLLALAQRLERPGQPRSRVSRGRRMESARGASALPDRPAR